MIVLGVIVGLLILLYVYPLFSFFLINKDLYNDKLREIGPILSQISESPKKRNILRKVFE